MIRSASGDFSKKFKEKVLRMNGSFLAAVFLVGGGDGTRAITTPLSQDEMRRRDETVEKGTWGTPTPTAPRLTEETRAFTVSRKPGS